MLLPVVLILLTEGDEGDAFVAHYPAHGEMTRYDPGVMRKAMRVRVLAGKIDAGLSTRDCIAVPHCGLLGRQVWLVWPDGYVSKQYVCDCSNAVDFARHIEIGLVAEVSHITAVEHSVDMNLVDPRVPAGRYRLPLDGRLPGVSVWLHRPEMYCPCID